MLYLSWFIGLPALIISLVVSLIGVITKRASLVLIGAILIVPFSWYQGGWFILFLAVPLILLGASIAIRLKLNRLSWILFFLSFSVLALCIAKGIFTQ